MSPEPDMSIRTDRLPVRWRRLSESSGRYSKRTRTRSDSEKRQIVEHTAWTGLVKSFQTHFAMAGINSSTITRREHSRRGKVRCGILRPTPSIPANVIEPPNHGGRNNSPRASDNTPLGRVIIITNLAHAGITLHPASRNVLDLDRSSLD